MWLLFMPGVICAKPIARCGPGEAGLLGEWRLTAGLRVRFCAREGVGVGDGLLGPLRGPYSHTLQLPYCTSNVFRLPCQQRTPDSSLTTSA